MKRVQGRKGGLTEGATDGAGAGTIAAVEPMLPIIRIRKKDARIELPRYESSGASGMDIRAFLDNNITIPSLERAKIPTGLYMELPAGYEAQIRPRSGLAARFGITVLNAPGTIDSDYRGELEVILVNLGTETFTVNDGDRIAQMVICPLVRAEISEAEFLSETERGAGGFGSTGV